jgi:hypothetical protein
MTNLQERYECTKQASAVYSKLEMAIARKEWKEVDSLTAEYNALFSESVRLGGGV